MSHRTTWYVTTHDDGWQVRRDTATQATAVFKTKKEAVAKAEETVKANTPSRLIVHKADGSIQETKLYGGDVIEYLKDQHDEVEAKLDLATELDDRSKLRKLELVSEVTEMLSRHAAAEETVLYNAIREELPSQDFQVLESLEEHHVMKLLLAELSNMTPDDERWDAKVTVLKENVEHHHDEEEDELFPALRKAFTEQRLFELGDGVRAAYEAGPTKPHPKAPDEGAAGVVAAGVGAVVDRATGTAGTLREKIFSRIRG